MEISFNRTFSFTVKVFAFGGLYFPGSDVFYPRYHKIVRMLTYVMCAAALLNFIMETVNHYVFMSYSQAEGLTNLFMAISLGVALPTYIFLIYAHWKNSDMKHIIDIWENEMKNPPFPDDRKAEIGKVQKYILRIVRAEVFVFIIPLTIWSARTIVTKEPILPIVYSGDVAVSPATELISIFFGFFGYNLAVVWCTTENIKLLFMMCILAELNHLQQAAEKILTLSEEKETEPSERAEELLKMEEKFRHWIIYHQTVFRFSNEIITFLAPMIFTQEMSAVIFAFGDIFILLKGEVPITNCLSGLGYLFFYYYVMYATNNLGDDIRMKSAHILDTFNGREYYRYSKYIIRNVSIIQYISIHRPINLKAKWYKNLSRKSFGELASKGYEIIAFMSNFI